jgi:hypothetical protein
MKKGEELIWTLFEMVRELMPPTAANAERFQHWAEKFHALEQGLPDAPSTVTPVDDVEDEPAEDPHQHGSPTRRRRR